MAPLQSPAICGARHEAKKLVGQPILAAGWLSAGLIALRFSRLVRCRVPARHEAGENTANCVRGRFRFDGRLKGKIACPPEWPVQLDRVRELRGEEAVLQDGSHIPVSRRRRGVLEHLLRNA
jgi:hypothetical protein